MNNSLLGVAKKKLKHLADKKVFVIMENPFSIYYSLCIYAKKKNIHQII